MFLCYFTFLLLICFHCIIVSSLSPSLPLSLMYIFFPLNQTQYLSFSHFFTFSLCCFVYAAVLSFCLSSLHLSFLFTSGQCPLPPLICLLLYLIWLSANLFLCFFICLYLGLSIHLCIRLSFCFSVSLFICPSPHLSSSYLPVIIYFANSLSSLTLSLSHPFPWRYGGSVVNSQQDTLGSRPTAVTRDGGSVIKAILCGDSMLLYVGFLRVLRFPPPPPTKKHS